LHVHDAFREAELGLNKVTWWCWTRKTGAVKTNIKANFSCVSGNIGGKG